VSHGKLTAVEFYPSSAPPSDAPRTEVGPYELDAAAGLPPASGRKPLLILSHGHGGSIWGHHDLAEELARAGFVVAAVEHAGDSWRDQSGSGTDRVLYGRAYQMSALIDAILGDPSLAASIDASRIGAMGFSAGGYTALLLLGAQPDFARLERYCARHPKDPELCGAGSVKQTMAASKPTADPRVRAAFVMAPLGVFFGPNAFDEVHAPVYIYEAAEDHVLVPDENAEAVHRALLTVHGFRAIPGADHYVFLAPCSARLADEAPDLCQDAPGIDRIAVHRTLARDADSFFARALAVGR
jgi:predicted dienelactone hydrolase